MTGTFSNLVVYIIINFVFLHFTDGMHYKEYQIEDTDLCSLIKKRKLPLGKREKSVLLVKETRLNDHSLEWLNNFRCKFEVSSPYDNGGVLAVIQHLQFRKNEEGECIDYIQFKGGDGTFSKKYCGELNATIKMDSLFLGYPTSTHISYDTAFIGTNKELDVIIFVSKEPLIEHMRMSLGLVLTAYQDCSQTHSDKNMVPCSGKFNNVCIYKSLFYDSYINCPYVDCVDEGGCLIRVSKNLTVNIANQDHNYLAHFYKDKMELYVNFQNVPEKLSVGNKVLIGSLSSLFILFAIFILCLWACKHHKILCWSENFSQTMTTGNDNNTQQSSRVIEMNEQTGARLAESRGNMIPSAPIEEDKDLPPSYDSLFPETR